MYDLHLGKSAHANGQMYLNRDHHNLDASILLPFLSPQWLLLKVNETTSSLPGLARIRT